MHMNKTLILIPVFNVGSRINELTEKIPKDSRIKEVLVIDDGSDLPVKIDERLGTLIRHKINLGKGEALKTGFAYALKDPEISAVMTIDGDGQHAVEDILPMLNAFYEKRPDMLIGSRKRDKTMPLSRKTSNLISALFATAITGQKIPDCQSGFRVYSREFLENVKFTSKAYDLENEAVLKAGINKYRIENHPIQTIYTGEKNSSHYKLFKDTFKIIIVFAKSILFRGSMLKKIPNKI